MATELFANNAQSTLNGAIGAGDATLNVTSAAGFPSTGNFRIIINSEIMLVTSVSTNTFTVTRGIEGTSAASHLNGATVAHIVTAGSLAQLLADHSPVSSVLSSDVVVTGQPDLTGTWTDLVTVSATCTSGSLLVQSHVSGDGAAATTLATRIQVDGTTKVTFYGSTSAAATQPVVSDIVFLITGLTNGSRSVKLQGIGLTASVNVSAASSVAEGASLVVTPVP